MDLSKPFDTINHELLIAKLYAYGFLKMLWNWSLVIWQIVGKEVKYINRLVLGLHLSKECLRNLSWDQYCLIFILTVYSIFLSCDICNFSDDTAPYVCDTNLAFVLAKLEKNSSIAMKWFDNNYMKMNSDKCHLLSLETNLNIFGLK